MENDEVTKRLNEALRMGFGKRGVQLKSDMAKALGYKSPYFSGITTGKEKLTNAFLENLSKTSASILGGCSPARVRCSASRTKRNGNSAWFPWYPSAHTAVP